MALVFSILFKSANLKFKDEVIECPADWSVKRLKQHVAVTIFKNDSYNLKLIYSGKLLTEEEYIGAVFLNQTNPVVYIVTPPPNELNQFINEETLSEGLKKRHVNNTTALLDTPISSLSQPPPAIGDPLSIAANSNKSPSISLTQQYLSPSSISPPMAVISTPYEYSHANILSTTSFVTGINSLEGNVNMFQWYNPGQIMWIQQQYLQYMNQYMQYMQRGYQSDYTHPLQPYTQHVEVQHPVPPINEILPPANPPQQPQVQRMNAQGGALMLEDEDDGRNRDWLDWAYVILRFAMLMCILYFYSTPTKFFTFILLSMLFFLYQAGWLDLPIVRRGQQAANQPENAEPQPQENQQHDDNVNANEEIINPVPPMAQPNNSTVNQPANQQPGFFSLFFSLIIGFFTSLAPQVPPPINAN